MFRFKFSLNKDKKGVSPPLPPYIVSYGINNVKFARRKGDTLETYHFDKEILRSHDPLNVVAQYSSMVMYLWLYKNEV